MNIDDVALLYLNIIINRDHITFMIQKFSPQGVYHSLGFTT